MTTATYEAALDLARCLSPQKQLQLIEALENLADVAAYDAAVAVQAGAQMVPLDQAVAELEAEWADAECKVG